MAAAALSGVVWFEYTGNGFGLGIWGIQPIPKGVTHVRFDSRVLLRLKMVDMIVVFSLIAII